MTTTGTAGRSSAKIALETLRATLGGAVAGLVLGCLVGALAVRGNASLQGSDQSLGAVELACLYYATLLAIVGAASALVAGALRRSAPELGLVLDFAAPLIAMLLFALAGSCVKAVAPWRFENDALRVWPGVALGFAGATATRLFVPRSIVRTKWAVSCAGVAALASLVFAATTIRAKGAAAPSTSPTADAPSRTTPPPRVMVIGVDGADWSRLQPLLDAGRLPNFARFCSGAYRSPLTTIEPTWSPIVWNTIATGVREDEHGVLDFTEIQLPFLERGLQRSYPKYRSEALLPQDVGLAPFLRWLVRSERVAELPVTALQRRRKAFWDILAERGIPAGSVRWWASWPASELDGFLVSDNDPMAQVFAATKSTTVDANKTTAHMTWPPELVDELMPLIEADGPFSGSDPQPVERLLREPVLADLVEQERDALRKQPNLLRQLELIVRGDRFATRAGLHLWRTKQVPMLAVYLRAVDNVSHRFWSRTGAVDRTYEFTDDLLGQLLDAGGEDTTYLLVSDHGWVYEAGAALGHPHAPPGVFIARGPNVRSDAKLERTPHVLDIAPTVLALYGLAPDRRFGGRALLELFAEGTPASAKRAADADYGDFVPVFPRGLGAPQAGQRAAVDLLRSLGYLGD